MSEEQTENQTDAPWPSSEDHIFRRPAKDSEGAGSDELDWLLREFEPDLDYKYREGYYQAGRVLAARLAGEDHGYVLYPMLFAYRHYVELSIKSLIVTYAKYNDVAPGLDCRQEHSLLKLWNEAVRQMQAASEAENDGDDTLRTVERSINRLNQIDNTSQLFRYPTDKGGKSVEGRLPSVTLHAFVKTIEGLHAFFEGCKDELASWIEARDEMRVAELRDRFNV